MSNVIALGVLNSYRRAVLMQVWGMATYIHKTVRTSTSLPCSLLQLKVFPSPSPIVHCSKLTNFRVVFKCKANGVSVINIETTEDYWGKVFGFFLIVHNMLVWTTICLKIKIKPHTLCNTEFVLVSKLTVCACLYGEWESVHTHKPQTETKLQPTKTLDQVITPFPWIIERPLTVI